MKAAIYCRLSKEDEERRGESESIQNQKSLLLAYAANKGYDVYGIYSDEDYSGIDRDRPAFNAMIRAAAEHRFDIILAKTQSRFTRDMELVEKYLHGKFIEWGIRFIAVVDHVDTDDTANKKARQINGLVNEWYLEDLSANVRTVLTHKRQSGRYIGSFALYGYAKDPLDHNHLVIDPEAAAVVRRIFALAAAGQGASRIAKELNEAGIPAPTRYKQQRGLPYQNPNGACSAGQWSLASIHQILRNQTYTGDLVQGRHKKVSYKSKKMIWTPKEQWIIAPNTHEPIIGRSTFALVQSMRQVRARAGSRTGTVHPLAQKVRCGCCGAAMQQTGNARRDAQGNRVRYLRCGTRRRSRALCSNPSVYLPTLEAVISARIRQSIAHYFAPDALCMERMEAALFQGEIQREAELERLKADIARRSDALCALYLDKCSGLLSEEQYGELNRAYREERERFQSRALQLEQEVSGCQKVGERRRLLAHRIDQLTRADHLTRELVCLLIDSVTVYPQEPGTSERRIEIAWLF